MMRLLDMVAAAAAAILASSTPVVAQAVASEAGTPSPVPAARPADEPMPSPGGRAIVADAELGTNRGGDTKVVASQTLSGVATGNVLNGDYAAGAVSISDKALSSFNGIGNFAINTGAQVSLQSGMNLTINVAQ